jgi:D-serine deaminase-like pyridoxal phosphate-dependent protein
VVDLELMEQNLHLMARCFESRLAKLRPHFKTHQVIELARRQVKAGAIGITVARVHQAELLVKSGIRNILIASEIGSASMIERFVQLSRRAPVIITVDNRDVISSMARLAGDRAHDLNVVVDLDLRLRRCGVPPGEPALDLTKFVLSKGLNFRGLMGYAGHVHLPPGEEKDRAAIEPLRALAETKALIERAGIPVEIVSCGATGDHSITSTFAGVTENQAGSYLLMDAWYAPCAPEFKPALSLLTTVISKTDGDRIIVDGGVKATSGERGLPAVKGIPELRVRALNAEHTTIGIEESSNSILVGDQLELTVNFLDATISLHDRMYGVRRGKVEEILEIVR